MTPSLAKIYESLVARVADFPLEGVVAKVRERFVARVGAFAPTDAWFEERSAALWDRVLCDPEVHARLAWERSSTVPPEEQRALSALRRAQRGLFEAHASGGGVVDLVCLARGGAFRLAPSDDQAAALARADAAGPGALLDAHVVATPEGVAMLPGLLVHPAEAHEPIAACVARARTLGIEGDDLLDALLAMRHQLAARSRVRPHQVYRPEALRREA